MRYAITLIVFLLAILVSACLPSQEEMARREADRLRVVSEPCREACVSVGAVFLRYTEKEYNSFVANVPDSCLCLKDDQPLKLW